MAQALFVILLILGALGAVLFTLRRRGWMRNGYFTIGASIVIAFMVMIVYQSLAPILMLILPGGATDNPRLLLAMNSIAQLTVLVGGTFFLIRATEQDVNATLRFEGVMETPLRLYLLGPLIMLCTTIVFGGISQFWVKLLEYLPFYDEIEALNKINEEAIETLTKANNLGDLAVIFLAVAIVPAIAEEVFFRGFLQTNIERSGHGRARPYVALTIASIIFGAVHVSPFQLPGLIGLGLAMGYMTYRTNNLTLGVLAHAFNNGLFVLAGYSMGSLPDESKMAEELEPVMLITAIVMGAVGLAMLIRLFHFWSEPIMARGYADEELRRTTVLNAAEELELYNSRLMADLEAHDREMQEKRPTDSERNNPDDKSFH